MTAVAPDLSALIKAQAFGLGFNLAGITSLGPVESYEAFTGWLEKGFAGEMNYLPRASVKRSDTRLPFENVKSAIVVGLDYGGRSESGPIARYARGDDYHDVMLAKLEALHRWIEASEGRAIHGKAYVDTGPILERDLARKAGLGWFGKNTMLLNPKLGSFFFLGVLLLDIDLQSDAAFEQDRCGSCTRCLDACPTGALVEGRAMDATKCIAYLTIELHGSIPEDLREPMGSLIYGCDICQDVCPWNVSFAKELTCEELSPREDCSRPDLEELLGLNEDQFQERFRGSPIKRTKRRGMARNVAVAMGNSGDQRFLPALQRAASSDPDAVVREHAIWALNKIDQLPKSTVNR